MSHRVVLGLTILAGLVLGLILVFVLEGLGLVLGLVFGLVRVGLVGVADQIIILNIFTINMAINMIRQQHYAGNKNSKSFSLSCSKYNSWSTGLARSWSFSWSSNRSRSSWFRFR